MLSVGIDPGLDVTGIIALDTSKKGPEEIVLRASSRSSPEDSDDDRRDKIVNEVSRHLHELYQAKGPLAVTLEGYEFQGQARSGNSSGARVCLLIGELRRRLLDDGHRVRIVTRNTWGRALGVRVDSMLKPLLTARFGVRPGRSAHEDDAAALAWVGAKMWERGAT